MLKNNKFFILVIFLLCALSACKDDKKEQEVSCPEQEVSGGEVAGGSLDSDMGLEGGQSSDQETQPTGGSVVDLEDPQGGVQGGEDLPAGGSNEVSGGSETPEILPAGGAQEEPSEGGSTELVEETEEVSGGEVASEEDVPADGGALVEEEESEG